MQLSVWATDTIAPPSIHILRIALRYNMPGNEITKVSYLLRFINKTRAQFGFTPEISIF